MKQFRLTPEPYPSESQEQAGLVRWAQLRRYTLPELDMLVSIPNGSKRDVQTGVRLVREGLRKGFPDMALFVKRGDYGALFIELKRRTGGRISPDQTAWHERLKAAGYAVAVCYGASEAIQTIENYLSENLPAAAIAATPAAAVQTSTPGKQSLRGITAPERPQRDNL